MESLKSFGNVLQFLIGDWRHREKIQNFGCRENTAQKSTIRAPEQAPLPTVCSFACLLCRLSADKLTCKLVFRDVLQFIRRFKVQRTASSFVIQISNTFEWHKGFVINKFGLFHNIEPPIAKKRIPYRTRLQFGTPIQEMAAINNWADKILMAYE